MFRFLGRVFRWFTLVSLILWAGVAWYIVQQQPVSTPPAGYPATVEACRANWALPLQYAEVRKQVLAECNSYYALLGDRSTPLLERLRVQVVGRIVSGLISDYLEKFPPQPGEVITGPRMIEALGYKHIGQLLLLSVVEANKPYAPIDLAQARCRLDETRRVQSAYDLAQVPAKCVLPR